VAATVDAGTAPQGKPPEPGKPAEAAKPPEPEKKKHTGPVVTTLHHGGKLIELGPTPPEQ
jgi:hypothetical protein